MSKQAERAKELLPAVMLTLLSMIQALALEFYWTQLVDSPFLFEGGWNAFVGWAQAVVVLWGILQVWVFYVSIVLRFSWLPSLEDALTPFFVGLLEFGMIETMHPDTMGPWLLLMGGIFALMVVTARRSMIRARREPANAYFFDHVEVPSWRDLKESIATVVILLTDGLILCVWTSKGLTVFAIFVVIAALTYQARQTVRYWLHSVTDESLEQHEDEGDKQQREEVIGAVDRK